MEPQYITLDHGSGGGRTAQLIEELLLPALQNPHLAPLGDGALLDVNGPLAFSTDSFVIDPIFFPGGDIGKLAVCGTVNDLAMCGAVPKYLSLGIILEEGFPVEDLKRIITSLAATAASCGVQVVTGDTKVVERGHGHGIYLNTSGIGEVKWPGLSPQAIREGDQILVSGTVGDHGTAVMLARSGMLQGDELVSDCMPLNQLAAAALSAGGVRVLRDPTRGGVATVLNEFVEGTPLCAQVQEDAVPVRPQVEAACALLGLDPLYCANEGKLLAVVDPETAPAVLEALHRTPGGENSAIIGSITTQFPGRAVLKTVFGAHRVLSKLSGAQLPRIC
ncbi:hydrogenase expression/formation protein HypE [Pseudoflavonifractor sp. SW1122]|uniref:hydrogenase expression/formation protein HypE n=1 Tax=Pseudoflavonifractor sp. SW1122 TaxID=2530044 RepID=UPI00143AB899|nr:hydrogenase expression/formation protein HypE [Pseudoflavonifractor sp. SW1122]NJE74770.1 hydrogenase expression/formation protein HypE [Pseudoflavonifractor sp. SW1122]